MHMVIHNAWAGDPYKIDTLFMYMANMAWNSTMNVGHHAEAHRQGSGDRRLQDPAFHLCRCLLPRPLPTPIWYCPTPPISSAGTASRCWTGRSATRDGAADAIRQPVVPLDRDVRAFQDVLLDLGARLKLPGMVKEDGTAKYPGGLKDYMTFHERRPGIGMLGGWRGADETVLAGRAQSGQLDRYIENGCFWRAEIPKNAVSCAMPTGTISTGRSSTA